MEIYKGNRGGAAVDRNKMRINAFEVGSGKASVYSLYKTVSVLMEIFHTKKSQA